MASTLAHRSRVLATVPPAGWGMMAPVTTLGQREVPGTAAEDARSSRRGRLQGVSRPLSRPRHARVAVLLALVVPVCAAIVLRRDAWVLTSDSVAQQSIVRTWFAVGHDRTYLPPDTWLLKLPAYVVVEALPLAPPARVLLESAVLAAVTAVLAGWAVWTLAAQAGLAASRRRRDVVLALGWVLTLGGGIGSYLVALPNSRNIELGLGLVVVGWAGHSLQGAPPSSWRPAGHAVRRGVGVAVLLAVLWVDDPYVAALIGWPLALAALAWFARRADRGGRDPRLLGVAAVLLGSLALVPLLRGLLERVGIVIVPDATAPTLDPEQLLAHLRILGPATVAELGLLEPGAAAATGHVLTVVLVVLGLVAAGAVAARGWRRGRVAVTFLGVDAAVVVAGVVANRTVYDAHAARYLVLAALDVAACLALGLAMVRERRPGWARPGTAVVAAALAVNLVSAAVDHPMRPALAQAQTRDHQEVLALLRLASRGAPMEVYGPFWTADLQTHLSEGEFQVVEVVCDSGRLRRRLWLTDSARERVRADRAAVIVPAAAPEFTGCTAGTIASRLGGSARSLTTSGGTTVLVVDRDVADLIGPG
jgi:hypothetical protein